MRSGAAAAASRDFFHPIATAAQRPLCTQLLHCTLFSLKLVQAKKECDINTIRIHLVMSLSPTPSSSYPPETHPHTRYDRYHRRVCM